MKRFNVPTIVLSLLLMSCAGQAVGAQSGEPVFHITAGNLDDQIEIVNQSDKTLIDIASPKGIGSATLRLESGSMPEHITLRLHLRGLEKLRLTSDQTSIEASVSNSDPADVHERVVAASSDTPLLPDQPLWMKVEIVSEQPVESLPLEDGYFEVTIPTEFLQKAGTSFFIEWIDFHR